MSPSWPRLRLACRPLLRRAVHRGLRGELVHDVCRVLGLQLRQGVRKDVRPQRPELAEDQSDGQPPAGAQRSPERVLAAHDAVREGPASSSKSRRALAKPLTMEPAARSRAEAIPGSSVLAGSGRALSGTNFPHGSASERFTSRNLADNEGKALAKQRRSARALLKWPRRRCPRGRLRDARISGDRTRSRLETAEFFFVSQVTAEQYKNLRPAELSPAAAPQIMSRQGLTSANRLFPA